MQRLIDRFSFRDYSPNGRKRKDDPTPPFMRLVEGFPLRRDYLSDSKWRKQENEIGNHTWTLSTRGTEHVTLTKYSVEGKSPWYRVDISDRRLESVLNGHSGYPIMDGDMHKVFNRLKRYGKRQAPDIRN